MIKESTTPYLSAVKYSLVKPCISLIKPVFISFNKYYYDIIFISLVNTEYDHFERLQWINVMRWINPKTKTNGMPDW